MTIETDPSTYKPLILFVAFVFALQGGLTAQAETVPMIKLVPIPPSRPLHIEDSLVYHFPMAEGAVRSLRKPKSKQPVRKQPAYYINDSLVTFDATRNLDPSTIDSVNVLRGAAADERHRGTGKTGVVLIYLKKNE